MKENITCISCKKTPSEQRENRMSGWTGDHCTPGRCIVNGKVWRTFDDGMPVDWELTSWDKKIMGNYKNEYACDYVSTR